MRYFISTLLYLKILAVLADEATTEEKFVTCEYSDTDWQPLNTRLHTCDIFTDTIDSPNFKIKYEPGESEKVEGLRFNDNKNVNFLPNNIAEIFPNLKGLTASNTYLNTLSSNDLKGLSKLKYISFANSDLKVIEDNTFKDQSELVELDLSDSNIRFIEEDGFHGMTSLKTLYLSGNKLSYLEPKTFDGLTSLESLSMELNHLEYIDENLFSTNENLADIWLNKNKIIGMPYKVIESLPKFSYLDLRENPCIDDVFDESNLDDLKEVVNEKCTAVAPPRDKPKKVIEVIEEIFEETIVDTSRNEYNIDGDIDTGLINQFIKYTKSSDDVDESLVTNDISAKTVECVVVDMHWKLSNSDIPTCDVQNQIINSRDFKFVGVDGSDLKAMTFAQNKNIRYLPENIGKFAPKLEEFSARNASLQIITKKNFDGLKHLKSLNLADNKIKFINPDAFDDLVMLEELDLSGNELETLDDEIFRKLKNLKVLRIGGNKMHELRPNLFKNLRNLVNVSMSHQQISDINEHAFKQNTKLKNIWMNSNKFSSLSPNMFSKMKELEYVDLRDNKCIDKFYETSSFAEMKAELHERCGKNYKITKGVKIDSPKKKGKKKKDKKKKKQKEKIPKHETSDTGSTEEKEVICEYEDIFWPHSNENLKTCVINDAISDPNYLINANSLFTEDFVNGEDIQAISFRNNKNVKYFPKNLFEVFPNLVEFSAADAGLEAIQPENFKGLQKLKYLDLSGNGLTHIDHETFKDLTSLEELILDNNDIEDFEEETFTYTKVLKKLRMKGNKLKTIQVTWFEDMPELEEISFNLLSSVIVQPSTFEHNPNLKVVEWNDVQYDSKLNELKDGGEEVECKYEEIYDADTGEMVEVCEIVDTMIIDSPNYVIKSSPRNNGVKKLFIANNDNIKFLPKNIGESFPKLEEIVVDDTALDVIKRESFENLPHLRSLKLRKNKLHMLDSDTFDDLPQLEELDMSENDLEMFGDGAFYKLKNLRSLKLGSNKLSHIDPSSFKFVNNLKTLSLPNNKLQSLDRYIFRHNPNIEEIDLDGNDIDSMNPKMFEKLRKLKRVTLKGNKCLDADFDTSQLSDLKNEISSSCKAPAKAHSKEISCELKDVDDITIDVVDITTCVVDEDAEIDEPGYKIVIDSNLIDPSHVKTLILANNSKVRYMPENVGELFPNLENLEVTNTFIDDLPEGIFKDMENVENVDLSNNKIKKLHPKSFTGLSSIKKILLNNNELEEIDDEPFKEIPTMTSIDISGNKIKKLPDDLFEFFDHDIEITMEEDVESPKEVLCSDIKFDHSEGQLECTVNDQVIDSAEYLLKMPKNLGIKKFKLIGDENVKYLPKNIPELFPNVKTLEIHETFIDDVPEVLEGFVDLDTLDMSGNKIKSLKPLNFPKLKKFLLDNNDLDDIHESWFDFPSLETLSLNGNKISSIPKTTFHKLPKLTYLSLDDNDEALELDEEMFDPIKKKNLKISYTKDGSKVEFPLSESDTEDEEVVEYEEVEVIKKKNKKKKKQKTATEEYDDDDDDDTTDVPVTNEVECEFVDADSSEEDSQICVINDKQSIDGKGFKINSPIMQNVLEVKIENNKNVKYLPENIGEVFPNLNKLTVKNTSVSEVPSKILDSLPKMKVLDFSDNEIEELDPELLKHTPNIVEINLSGNKIRKLPENIFNNVPKLEGINLDDNKITEIDPEIFKNLPVLTTLSVLGNELPEELNEHLFPNNPFLDILSEKSATTSTTSHPETDEVACVYGYVYLTLSSNEEVKDIFACVLDDKPITKQNIKIKQNPLIPQVKALTIENTKDVKFLPENIGELFPYLEIMLIKNTSIADIPKDVMKNLGFLKIFDLPNNEIEELDPEMFNDAPIEVINLKGNKIKQVPGEIFKIPTLRKINLEDNQISELDPEFLENIPNFEEVLLDGNNLPDTIFEDMLAINPTVKIKRPTTTEKSTDEGPKELECQNGYYDWVPIDDGDDEEDGIDGDEVISIYTCVIEDQPITEQGFKIKPTPHDGDVKAIKIENDKDVKFVPDNIGELFPNLERVSIKNTSISEIPKETFENMPNVKAIDLSDNKLEQLDPEIFNSIPLLEEINLDGNEILELPKEIFDKNPELKVIKVDNNEISELDPEIIENLPKLTKLSIGGNDLPDEIIEELHEKNPSLKVLQPKSTVETTTIKEEVIKEVECELEYDEWNYLNGNDNLYTCKIEKQPIDDKNVKIKTTPHNQHVEGVKIVNNKDVKFIPENIGELFPNLKMLEVENTSVSEVPKEVVDNTPNLKVLDLSGNKIEHLDPEMLNDSPNIEEVNVAGNKLKELPKDIFKNNPELKVVKIDNNEISELDPDIFENNPKLETLIIDGNELPDEVIKTLKDKNPHLSVVKPEPATEPTTTEKSTLEAETPEEVECELGYAEWMSVDEENDDMSNIFTCTIKQPITDKNAKVKETPYNGYIHGLKIENNKNVKFIPENIGELFPNLERMSVKDTKVFETPSNVLDNLDNLKVLDLSGNELKNLDPEMFSSVPMLEEINLSRNKIPKVPEDVFRTVPELKVINLDENEITDLEPKIFENLPYLKKLSIKGNNIPDELTENLFVDNPYLKIIKSPKSEITESPIKVTTESRRTTTRHPTRTTTRKGTLSETDPSARRGPRPRTTTRLPKTTETVTEERGGAGPTSRPTQRGQGYVTTTPRTTQTTRRRGQQTTTTTSNPSIKRVKCEIIYEPSEFENKNVVKCDMTDEEIEDPEVSFVQIPNGENVEVLKLDNNKNIKYLPDNIANIFPNLKEITAKNSAIDSILPGDFADLDRLQNIVLSGNEIKTIEPETFDGLDNLKNLDLSNNQIEFIDEDAFGHLPSLKDLKLENNNLTFIHPKTFQHLPKLETLDIRGNEIPSLNKDIFNKNPRLKNIEHAIRNFEFSIKTTQKPPERSHTTSTTRPKLPQTTPTTQRAYPSRRPQVQAPREVACEYEEIYWNLSNDNYFSCNLDSVTIDDPNYVIKPSPKNKRIKGLNFVHNPNVKYLPQNIGNVFPNLVEISAYNTSIKDIPKDALKNLPKLRGLNFMASDISSIDPNAFDDLYSLELLDLSDNKLNNLDPNILKNLPNLKFLYVNSNGIKELEPNVFENLPDLRNISLEGNELTEVDRKLFGRNFELQNVWLNDNKINAIDPTIFDGKRALEYVDLRGNDCIDSIFEGYGIEGIRNTLRNKCKSPEENRSTTTWTTSTSVPATERPINYRTTTGRYGPSGPTRRPTHSWPEFIDEATTTRKTVDYYGSYTQRPTLPTRHRGLIRTQTPRTQRPIYSYDLRTHEPDTTTQRSRGPQHFVGQYPEVTTPSPKEVKCSLNYHEFPGTGPEVYTCIINEQSIDDPEYVIGPTPHNNHVRGVAIDDDKNVKFLPKNIGETFPNLNHLSAKHNSIEYIPNLKNLENVKTLDLSDNGLTLLDPELLKNLPSLEELNLSGNQIPQLIDGTFDNLPNLKVLDLSRNNMLKLPKDIFSNLPELRKVSIDNNHIKELPEKIFEGNPKLEVVSLNGNKISTLNPHIFENLPNLGEVNMEENPCISGSYKPGTFYAMKSDLVRNCAPDGYIPEDTTTRIPIKSTTEKTTTEQPKSNTVECNYGETFSSTSNEYLTSCIIGENKAVEDPNWEIAEVPQNKRVKRLMVYDNKKIEKLPNNLGEAFPELTDIVVTDAPIKSLHPDDLKDLNKLKSLAITGGSIKVLEPETFKGAPNLEDIDLSSNNIRHVDDNTFKEVPKVKSIDLSGNKIPKLSNEVFKPLPELKTLKLTGNDLQNIDGDIFKGNPKLYKVSIDENNLQSIDPDAFDRLPHLLDVNLSKNDCIDRAFGTSNMHMLRKIVNEHCQPYETLKNELKTCKKEVENCISRPKEGDTLEKERLKDTVQKSNAKIKQLNMQINKLRNALNAEKESLKKEIQKSKNLQHEIDEMKRSCVKVNEHHNMLIDLNCDYNEQDGEKYACNARDLKIKIENSTIENPIGTHQRGKRDTDVNSLIIYNQDAKYLPNGIANHFPYLNELAVERSGLSKLNDVPLKNLKYLNRLIIKGNDIQQIEPNALSDVPQLEYLDLSQNNIVDVPLKLLENVPNLKVLNLNDNALLSLPHNIIPNVNKLKTFTVGNNNLNFIDPRIFKHLNSVDVIDITNNRCIDKKYNGNGDDESDYMSFIGVVSVKCTNDDDDGFCKGRKI